MLSIANRGIVNEHALTLLGATTKDGQDTIGQFGSGFKYAIAQLLRENYEVIIYNGVERIEFTTELVDIGGCYKERILMNGQPRDWTTDFGKKNWKGVWMALREMLCNAIDAGEYEVQSGPPKPREGWFTVYISMTDELRNVLEHLNHYIRPDMNEVAPRVADKGRVYCKGVFVKELGHSIYDYNLPLELSESRTVSVDGIMCELTTALNKLPLAMKKTVLRRLSKDHSLKEARITTWGLYGSDWKTAFDETFPDQYLAVEGTDGVEFPLTWTERLASIGVPTYWDKIKSAVNCEPIAVDRDIDHLVKIVEDQYNYKMPPIKWFKYVGSGKVPLGVTTEYGINLNADLSRDIDILSTLLHEMAHWISKCGDNDVKFVDTITNAWASSLSRRK